MARKEKNGGNKKRGLMLFSIRNKIIMCFFVPIVFMIVIGASPPSRLSPPPAKTALPAARQPLRAVFPPVTVFFAKAGGSRPISAASEGFR